MSWQGSEEPQPHDAWGSRDPAAQPHYLPWARVVLLRLLWLLTPSEPEPTGNLQPPAQPLSCQEGDTPAPASCQLPAGLGQQRGTHSHVLGHSLAMGSCVHTRGCMGIGLCWSAAGCFAWLGLGDAVYSSGSAHTRRGQDVPPHPIWGARKHLAGAEILPSCGSATAGRKP